MNRVKIRITLTCNTVESIITACISSFIRIINLRYVPHFVVGQCSLENHTLSQWKTMTKDSILKMYTGKYCPGINIIPVVIGDVKMTECIQNH